ncbi:MAG: hypothetical protein JXR94_01580 [Candidatus Hydrogenedentes bacterium]|nr:hypothetical protein [Candidatus Hydrogenedentota bacterium]
MRHLSILAVGILLAVMCAGAGAQDAPAAPAPPPAPPGPAAPAPGPPLPPEEDTFAEVGFEEDVYDLFQAWLDERGEDGLLWALRVPSDEEAVATWIRAQVLGHREPVTRGDTLVLAFGRWPLDTGTAEKQLSRLLDVFEDVMKEREQAAEEEAQRRGRMVSEQEEASARAQLLELRHRSARELMGRQAGDIEEELRDIDRQELDMRLERAELEARLDVVQRQLAEQEPIILVAKESAAEVERVRKETELALERAKREHERVEAMHREGLGTSEQLEKAAERVKQVELAMTGLEPHAEEIVNPIYMKLKEMLVDLETNLAGIVAREQVLNERQAKLMELVGVAYEFEQEAERLEAVIRPQPPRIVHSGHREGRRLPKAPVVVLTE